MKLKQTMAFHPNLSKYSKLILAHISIYIFTSYFYIKIIAFWFISEVSQYFDFLTLSWQNKKNFLQHSSKCSYSMLSDIKLEYRVVPCWLYV